MRVVHVAAAELVERDRLTRDDPYHLRPGDEHVALAGDDEYEIGDGGRVHRAARAGSGDDADLRDHARGADVAEEDVRVPRQRDHAFLDARPARVVDADDRHAVAQGKLLHLDDLFRRDLAERAAEHGRVVRVDGDRPPVHLAESRHHAVARQAPLLHAETVRAVRGEHVELDERSLVEQHLDPVSCGQLAGGAPFVRGFGFRVQRLVAALAIEVELLLGDAGRRALRRLDALDARGRSSHRSERSRSTGCHSAYRRRVPEYGPAVDLDRTVTLRQLRTFKTVADLSSFSLAAQRLKLSQPSISYQVKELEEALGLPLLDRLGKRVALTEAGTMLYAYARRMLDTLDEAAIAVEEMRGMQRGTLRVGASTTVGIYLLPAALGAFKKMHPGLVISLEIGTRARVQEQVLNNELDLAVVGPALKDPDLAIVPFLTDELVVVAPAGHPMARRRGLGLKDLEAQPFVMREAASGSRWSLEKAARKAGAKLTVAMELGSNGAIKHAVESGLGLAVISRYACALEVSSGRLVELDVKGFPIRRDWHIVHLRKRRMPLSVKEFIEFLKDTTWISQNGSRGRVRPPSD